MYISVFAPLGVIADYIERHAMSEIDFLDVVQQDIIFLSRQNMAGFELNPYKIYTSLEFVRDIEIFLKVYVKHREFVRDCLCILVPAWRSSRRWQMPRPLMPVYAKLRRLLEAE